MYIGKVSSWFALHDGIIRVHTLFSLFIQIYLKKHHNFQLFYKKNDEKISQRLLIHLIVIYVGGAAILALSKYIILLPTSRTYYNIICYFWVSAARILFYTENLIKSPWLYYYLFVQNEYAIYSFICFLYQCVKY